MSPPPLRTLRLSPVEDFDRFARRLGSAIHYRDYTEVIRDDTDIYDASTGALICRFRRAVFKPEIMATTLERMRPHVLAATSFRKHAICKNIADYDAHRRSAHSLIVGYWDKRDIRTTQLYKELLPDADAGAPMPNTICRPTAFVANYPEDWAAVQEFIRKIAAAHRRYGAREYSVQKAKAAAAMPAYIIPGTPYSTTTINYNWSTKIHLDAGDAVGSLGNLSVIGNGAWTGAYLVFPRFRVAIDMRPGDFMLMNVHEYHGNTAIRPATGAAACAEGPARMSFVCYLRDKIPECRRDIGAGLAVPS